MHYWVEFDVGGAFYPIVCSPAGSKGYSGEQSTGPDTRRRVSG
jgi:hypothetical protein